MLLNTYTDADDKDERGNTEDIVDCVAVVPPVYNTSYLLTPYTIRKIFLSLFVCAVLIYSKYLS